MTAHETHSPEDPASTESSSNGDAASSSGEIERVSVERVNVLRTGAEHIAIDSVSDADVEQVVAVRADDPISQLGQRTASVMGTGAKIFFNTIKRMLLLALVLAAVGAWFAENAQGAGSRVLIGIGAFAAVFLVTAGAGLMLAGQRAVAAVSLETWRQTGLISHVLNMLLDKVAGIGKPGEQPATPPVGLPLADAKAKLNLAAKEWVEASAERSVLPGVIRTAQKWLAELVRQILIVEFKSQAKSTGGMVRVLDVREALAGRADDLIAARVRSRMFRATVGTIAATIVLCAGIAYAISRLGQ